MVSLERTSRHLLRWLRHGHVIQHQHPLSVTSSRQWYGTDHHSTDETTHKKTSSDGGMVYTYEGPFSQAVKKVKHLSLFSCFVTLSSCPVMLFLDPATLVEGAAATSMTARMSLAATLSAFGLGTTGLLHWFTYPYVHRLSYNGKDLEIETATFLAAKQVDIVHLDDIEAGAPGSMHPLSTFRAGRIFYVDTDYFHDKQLLTLLTGEDTETPNT